MKVFVTGATGFIGANVIRRFAQKNRVSALVRHSSNLWRLGGLEEKVQIIQGDIKDSKELKKILDSIRPEVIIHSAVYGGFPNQSERKDIFETNLDGTINLLEASKDLDYSLFLNFGSSSEYGLKNKPMSESDLIEPNTDYGVAKAAATLYANSFARKLKKPVVTLRLFSPYGSFEDKNRLIPYVIQSYIQDTPLKIGNFNTRRDFIFIEDVLDAIEKIMSSKKDLCGEVINIGSGEQHSVGEVIETIAKIFDYKKEVQYDPSKQRVYDTSMWVADISKLKTFGGEPKYSFEAGLAKAIEWFKENQDRYYGNQIL